MSVHNGLHAVPAAEVLTPKPKFPQPENCPLASCSAILAYEGELKKHSVTEARLRRSVAREIALLRQKDNLTRQKDILSRESEHRLLNGLQLITSLLSIQSRATKNAEVAAQLTIAANRVASLGRLHRHLHALEKTDSIELKHYIENLCRDLSAMASNENRARDLVVTAIELRIPTVTAIPLGFIASELITNAIKYSKGRIEVRLQITLGNGYALSVSDDGPGLPEGFDPTATSGLGMKLVSSLVKQIGGQLQFDRDDDGKGTRFTVLFS